jgi:predicted metal-dependent hydrolase
MNFTDATIIYSRRRSISLVITDEAKLVVRAPHRFPQKYIHDFIISKNRWIANKIREVSSRPLPPAILDYVIIHDLVHLSESNHSRRFWNKVAVILPDHKTRRQWIKKNNFLLKV